MKLFQDCLKSAGVKSGHVVTALGNENYRFGRSRSQPKRRKFRYKSSSTVIDDDGSKAASNLAAVMNAEEQKWRPGNKKPKKKSWNIPLDIKKYEPDQQLIFGWASVIEKDGKIIVDKQGDIIPVAELENAAYEFTLNSRQHGDMHRRPNMGRLVESMVFTKEKQKALGIDIGQIGWWVGFKVSDTELWAAHKRGERPEFSIGGAAIPVEIEVA